MKYNVAFFFLLTCLGVVYALISFYRGAMLLALVSLFVGLVMGAIALALAGDDHREQ